MIFRSMTLAFIYLFVAAFIPPPGFSQDTFNRYIQITQFSKLWKTSKGDIAKDYDLVITGTEVNASVAAIKKINPNFKAIFYRDFGWYLYLLPDDWRVVLQHPDWFVRDTSTNRPIVHKKYGWYLMDVTNAGFCRHLKEYILQKLASSPAFDGVFLDDTMVTSQSRQFYY